MKDNIVLTKSFNFAIIIIELSKILQKDKKEFVISKQLLRSGTSIGANIKEAVNGFSKKDFIAKMYVALKEANETEYWLELLNATDYLAEAEYKSIVYDCKELCKLLSSITKSAKQAPET